MTKQEAQVMRIRFFVENHCNVLTEIDVCVVQTKI
jgi:hypothetical protein